MAGHALDRAAAQRQDIDITLTCTTGAKCDPRAVRREARVAMPGGVSGQPLGHTARDRHNPDVSGVDERDLRAVGADRRCTEVGAASLLGVAHAVLTFSWWGRRPHGRWSGWKRPGERQWPAP